MDKKILKFYNNNSKSAYSLSMHHPAPRLSSSHGQHGRIPRDLLLPRHNCPDRPPPRTHAPPSSLSDYSHLISTPLLMPPPHPSCMGASSPHQSQANCFCNPPPPLSSSLSPLLRHPPPILCDTPRHPYPALNDHASPASSLTLRDSIGS